MRNRLSAALLILLTGHGFVLAQQNDPIAPEPGGISAPLLAADQAPGIFDSFPVSYSPLVDADTRANSFSVWGSSDYLLWWFKNGRVPPLVTGGGDGVPGTPGTRVLFDDLADDNVRQGARFTLGYQSESNPGFGVNATFFILPDRSTNSGFSSDGELVLGRPYIDVDNSLPAATLIAFPGKSAGSVDIASRTGLLGTEGNLTANLFRSEQFYLTALGGFRFLKLDDELQIDEQFHVSPSVPGFGGSSVSLRDDFRTVNNFYGAQVGLETGVRLGRVTIDLHGKLALGQMQQFADIGGGTDVLKPNGSTAFFPGGLLALSTNIGHFQHDELAFLPEVGVNVGYQLTSHLKVYAGYSFLWVSTVARAGEQIDPVINTSQFPILSAGPLVGSPRPSVQFRGTDFWAQGVNLGLELKY